MERKYIITADDYGLCDTVNEAIENLAKSGKLSSTNVIMNFQKEFANCPLKSGPDFSIGLHWNVTTGKPVSSPGDVPSLVDENGNFWSIDEFRNRFHRGLIDSDELKKELQTQFDLFKQSFGQPVYWNTHENSSLYPKEYAVFKAVAKANNIKSTRTFQRVYIDYDLCRGIKRKLREFLVKSYVNVKFGILERNDFSMPDARIVTFVNKSKTDFSRLKSGFAKSKKEIIEVIIHPSTSADNEYFGNIAEDRVKEYECFMSEQFYGLFENESAHIVSFESVRK